MVSFKADNQAWIILLGLSIVASCISTACSTLSIRGSRPFIWQRWAHECLVRHHVVYPNFYFSIIITTDFVHKSALGAQTVCFLILLSFLFLLIGTIRLRDQTDDWYSAVESLPHSRRTEVLLRAFGPTLVMSLAAIGLAVACALNPDVTKR